MQRTLPYCTLAVVLCGLLLPSCMPRACAGVPLVSGWEPAGDPRIFSGENASFLVNCTAPGCASLAFQWSVDGALVPGETGPSFRFLAGTNLTGTFRISVFVTDGNVSDRNAWNLTVEPSVVTLPEGPVAMAEGEDRTFRVIGAGGRNVSWFLDGADIGQSGTEFVFHADHLSAGTHLVAASVQGGPVRTWTVTVADVNRPPVLAQGWLVVAYAGEPVSVRINASDPDGRPLRYLWDLDSDGVPEINSTAGGNLSHRFAKSGEYRATLTVTDDGGATASTVFLFEVRERAAPSGWWLPAALAAIAAAGLLIVVATQARRLSRAKEERARAGFFRERERPTAEAKAGTPPEAGIPGKTEEAETEPEVLQVRSLLPAKRAELEASAGHPESDIPLSKKLTPSGPPGVPRPESSGHSDVAAGALRDKGAEGETRAQETELGRRSPGARTR